MFGGNTETIVIHLREVHYKLAIACALCKSFTSMQAQIILEHHSGCKVKCAIEGTEQEGHEVKKSHKMKSKVRQQEKSFLKSVQVALMNPAAPKDTQHLLSNSR